MRLKKSSLAISSLFSVIGGSIILVAGLKQGKLTASILPLELTFFWLFGISDADT
jgi:hypothetical protein